MPHLLILLLALPFGSPAAPSGLLVNLLPSPALGVPARPRFSWIVPPSESEPDHAQVSYRLRVWAEITGGVVWDSGSVRSSSSATIGYGGHPLSPGTAYRWTVTTTSLGPAAESVPSESLSGGTGTGNARLDPGRIEERPGDQRRDESIQ